MINFSINETKNLYDINSCVILYEKLKDKIMSKYENNQSKSSGFTLDLTNFSYCIAIIFIIATVMSCIWCCHRLFRACKSKCCEPNRRRAPTTATQPRLDSTTSIPKHRKTDYSFNWPYLDFSIDRIYQPVITCLLINAKIILDCKCFAQFHLHNLFYSRK